MGTGVRTIGVRELKARTSAVLRELRAGGAEFVITLRGRPVARLEPLPTDQVSAETDGMGSLRGALTELPRLDWDDFVRAKEVWRPRPVGDD
jgi:prevent-host-death family protein